MVALLAGVRLGTCFFWAVLCNIKRPRQFVAVVVRLAVGVAWGLLEVGEFAEGWGEDEGDNEA